MSLMKRYNNWGMDTFFRDCDTVINTTMKSNFESLFDEFRGINLPKIKDGIKTYNVDVPGLSESDIKVSWDKDILTIEGKSEKYNRSVSYTTTMEDINPETLEATVENGILTVSAKLLAKKEGIKVEVKKK